MKKLIFLLFFLNGHAMAAPEIIPLNRGVTLASIEREGRIHTVGVIRDTGQAVQGIDLSRQLGFVGDPTSFYQEFGYRTIAQALALASQDNLTHYSYGELLSPAGNSNLHYAVGLNYYAHAKEEQLDAKPFTFLKVVEPTRGGVIPFDEKRLLDYEAEICAKPLRTLSDTTQLLPNDFAYFLCGDFSDRAKLLREMDIAQVQSGRGFSAAKSVKGYFPTGPYMVIPAEGVDLLADLEFKTLLNSEIRQFGNTNQLIWGVERIITNLLESESNGRETFSATYERWLPTGRIEESSTILTGTPEGVIMQPPGCWYKVRMGTWYIVSGAFLFPNRTAQQFVINKYLSKLFSEKEFLQSGDVVELKARWLGEIRVEIGH